MNTTPAPPTILQILPALNQGGIERGTLEIADAITRAGGRALVVSSGGRLEAHLRHVGAEHITLPRIGSRNPAHLPGNIRALRHILHDRQVSLVHARSRAPAWVARLACRASGTPFVTTWHGVHANNFPGKALYNAVLASGDRVIAISRSIAQRLVEDYGVGTDRLRLIPRGADITQFSPEAITGQRVHHLAEKWNLPSESPVILMPGRLTAWKGQSLVLQALQHLAATHPQLDWRCVFVGSAAGDGRYARELQEQAARSDIKERLHFAGHCDDMPAALALSAMVLAPSLKPEPFGRVVVEAQAMCRPVIVARHGAATETIEDGVTGLSIPPGDASALASAMARILTAPSGWLLDMATAARQMVLAHYTTWTMQHATLAVYDELLHTPMAQQFAAHPAP